jgi:hypothetical protein
VSVLGLMNGMSFGSVEADVIDPDGKRVISLRFEAA